MFVTVYSKPGCQQCKFTCLTLDHAGIPYDVVDLITNPAALEYVQDLGYTQAPLSSSMTTTTGQDSTPPKSNDSGSPSNNHPQTGNPVPHENLMRHSPAPPPPHVLSSWPITAASSHHDQFPRQEIP